MHLSQVSTDDGLRMGCLVTHNELYTGNVAFSIR